MIQIYRDPHYIEKFSLYGERHSGTNFLEQTIKQTFEIDSTFFFGHKHWMGFANPSKILYNRQVLFFGIIRHPYDWISGFFNMPHHVPKQNKSNFQNFLLNEWYSVDKYQKEILHDRNFNTKPDPIRYKNIFDLRENKLLFLSETMPQIAKNYVLVNYEFLIKYQNKFINLISNRFNLLKKNDPPKPITKNKYLLDPKVKDIIDKNINWDLESTFGYEPR
jgi:hypothetical protein